MRRTLSLLTSITGVQSSVETATHAPSLAVSVASLLVAESLARNNSASDWSRAGSVFEPVSLVFPKTNQNTAHTRNTCADAAIPHGSPQCLGKWSNDSRRNVWQCELAHLAGSESPTRQAVQESQYNAPMLVPVFARCTASGLRHAWQLRWMKEISAILILMLHAYKEKSQVFVACSKTL